MSKSALIAGLLLLAIGNVTWTFAQHAAPATSREPLPTRSVVNWVQPEDERGTSEGDSTVNHSEFDPATQLDDSSVTSDGSISKNLPEYADEAVPSPTKRNSQPRGNGYRYKIPTYQRAGSPRAISRLAQVSPNPRYQLGYVGGGAAMFGSNRQTDQGVFGMDYAGLNPLRTVWLKWTNGEKYQGGSGAYKTDGRKILEH